MNVRTLAKLLVIGTASLVAVTAAGANCIPAKLASTFNEQGYVYIDMGSGVTSQQVVGRFIAAGATSNNNGTYGANEWLFVDLNGLLSMQANLGDARVNGCPANKLVTRIFTNATNPIRFLTLTALEGSCGSSSAFDFRCCDCPSPFPTGTILSGVPLPRPRVISSSRNGTQVMVRWVFDATASGNPMGDPAGAVTGYELVRATGSSDPGRNPASWTVAGSVASDGSGPATLDAPVDCSSTADQFFATRLLFSDGEKSLVVGLSTRIHCNPALAEPDFNIVPKRPAGPAKKPGTS